MTTETVMLKNVRTLDASPEEVRRAFTDPGRFTSWWGSPGTTFSDVEMEASEGGPHSFLMRLPDSGHRDPLFVRVSGEFTQVDEEAVAYTYQWAGSDHVTCVTAESAPGADGGTELTARHEGVPDTDYSELERVWNDSLERLEDLL